MVSVSFDPIGNWFVVAAFALGVTGLTVWAYWVRMRTQTGAWRWFALGLRLAAILLCLLAALRPSVVFQEKKKQPASLVFLIDDSSSMKLTDEARGQSRWDFARKTLKEARAIGETLGEGLTVKSYRFDSTLRDDPTDDKDGPTGRETSMGQAILDASKREVGSRIAAMVLLGDGANNSGMAPLLAARTLRGQQVPVITVGFGSEQAGANSRDIAVRDLVAGPTVFVKNQLEVKGTLVVRGYANQPIDLEMLVEGKDQPVATQRIRVPEGVEVVPISGLKYIPESAGEKRVTLRVKPKDGELVQSNNAISTFVTVLKGGLNVLLVQGSNFSWEPKYLMRAIGTSPDIQGDARFVRVPVRNGVGQLKDDDFAPNRYDVYVLSDLPANYLTPVQQALLARAVEKGAGLIMLGGRSSFGEGGWDRTEVGRILPVAVSRGDGQIEPETGIKFTPNPLGLENYLMQLGRTRADSERIWAALPPLRGINHLGRLKPNAIVFGQTPGDRPEPIMVGAEVGSGRVLAFAGETWVWPRSLTEEGLSGYRKFWRQVTFWLAHKEDKGENEVKIKLDTRRIATGQKLDFGVTARDAKGQPLTNLKYDAKVELENSDAAKFSDKLDVFNNGEQGRGTFFASQAPPGDYRVSVVATRDGKEVGRDSARFLVYQDDRELENPAADRALLRQIAEATGGESLAPEQLPKYLQGLKGSLFTESYSQTERKIWDNWPFLLLFAALLTTEWFLRKQHGWV